TCVTSASPSASGATSRMPPRRSSGTSTAIARISTPCSSPLVEAAGLRAYPVLIGSARKVDPHVPSPAQFDHMITAIPLGQDWIWLDSTTEVVPFRMLSANLRHKQALLIPIEKAPLRPGGAARLVETPNDLPFPATQRVEVTG